MVCRGRSEEENFKRRARRTSFLTLEMNLPMKASALHQPLDSRTGVKQSHSCNRRETEAGESSARSLLDKLSEIESSRLPPLQATDPHW